MANIKEYEMLYRLNAELGGSFNGTFSKAQQQLISMQKEIQALSKTQSDISAFQKQQNAVNATGNKLQVLQQQYDNIQKEMRETEGYSSSLENKLLSKRLQIEKTSSSLDQQTQKLRQMDDALQKAGVDTDNLEKESAQLGSKMDALKAEQEKAAESAQSFGASSTQAFDAIQQAIAAAGIATALKEIYDAYMECVSIAGDFEEAMSTVEALSGANAEEMAALNAEAKELGATTKFTAKEAADAMGYMGMAGWSAEEMLAGMDGVLQLAAASGEDLAMVSDIVTDSLSAFGLQAKDTAHFSDVLAAAATNSNTNVSIMGETFKMSASVAGALKYSVEDVAMAVGLMANSGVKGSIAGTALKNTFNGLLEGVTLTANAFGEYEYSAVKADGTMKGFKETIDELRVYFEQMTEAERVNNAMTIAGQRGYNGLLAILNATDEDYRSLAGSINNCTGAASKMAAIKLDNMNGELVLMNSAWDALNTTLGEQFTPTMRNVYALGTEIFNGLDAFVRENPALVKAVVAFTGVIGVGTVALTGYAAVLKIVRALELASLFTGTTGIILGAVAGVAAFTASIVSMVAAANEGVPSLKDLTEAARGMNEALEEANAAYEDNATQTIASAEVAEIYIGKLEAIETATGENVEGNQEYHNILALLVRTFPDLVDKIDLVKNSIDGGTEALREHTEQWKRDAEAQARQEYVNSLYDRYGAVLTESAENSIKLTKAQIELETVERKREAAIERMNELSREGISNDGERITEYYNLQYAIGEYDKKAVQAERTIRNLNEAIQADADAVSAAEAEIQSAQEAVTRLTGVTQEQIDAEIEAARQAQALQMTVESTAGRVIELAEAYTEAYDAAYDSISGQYSLWDKAEKIVATSAGSINKALESQVEYWQKYNDNLQTLGDRAAGIEGLGDIISSFADGSKDSVNAIAGMARASDDDLRKMVENWKTLQEEQKSASDSIAELKEGFSAAMDELQRELAADIEAMDLGNEAAESGKSTIRGFIDGAADMLPQVQAAYERVGQAAIDAINLKLQIHSPSRVMMEKAEMTWAGYIQQTEAMRPEVMAAMSESAGMAAEAIHAEEAQFVAFGPQLVAALNTYGSGGATAAVPLGSNGNRHSQLAPVDVHIHFHLDGPVSEETVEALRQYGDDFAERVLDVIEEHHIDMTRGAYS